MAVFRVHKTKNYTLMSNHHLTKYNKNSPSSIGGR